MAMPDESMRRYTMTAKIYFALRQINPTMTATRALEIARSYVAHGHTMGIMTDWGFEVL
jgi:hypothetical protein